MQTSKSKATWCVAKLAGLTMAAVVASAGPALATKYLKTNRSCSGDLLKQSQNLEIIGWDGDSREAHRRRVYDFRVRCDDGERDVIDLFLAAERSDRYKREGNVLSYPCPCRTALRQDS